MTKLAERIKRIDDLLGYGVFEEAKAEYIKHNLNFSSDKERIEFLEKNPTSQYTLFFRDDIAFEVFRHIVMPDVFENIKNRKIQIASVGCSRGSEPYSILLQNWGQRERIKFSGYDCNPENINEARLGYFAGVNMRDLGNNFDLSFLSSKDSPFLIEKDLDIYSDVSFSEEAKKYMSFKVHDITKKPLDKKFDVISILNVLPHYTEKGREIILENISESLNENGWLVCECSGDTKSVGGRQFYVEWMNNLSRFGLQKQKVIVPWWSDSASDMTTCSKVYKKI